MKKLTAVVLLFTVIFCFAACTKNKNNGGIYVPPQTEVITFEDGLTAVFEVVTEENGEVATDAEGETKYIPYIPPVTEEGGKLVTDAQGSTIPSRPAETDKNGTTKADVIIDNAIDEFTTSGGSSAQRPESTTAPSSQQSGTTKPHDSGTNPLTPSVSRPTATKPAGTTAPPVVTPPTEPATETVTKELDGTLTSAKAQKLYDMMEGIENPFEEDLVKADFYAAEKSIDIYIANIEAVINEIKADKALYQFVGNQQLTIWIENMHEAKDKYQIFMAMVKSEEGKTDKNPLYYQAYTDFQNSYRNSLEVYYFILFAAEDRI